MYFEGDFTRNDLTRQERLSVWLKRNKLSASKIGQKIGVSAQYSWRILRAERAPVARVEQLRALGIPDSLLPRAEDVPPGNKPGWMQAQAAGTEA